VLSYKVAETLRLWVIIVDNDTTACFDCMMEAPNNLACLQHGAEPLYFKLHAQTQASSWYGMGQGSGDGCNQWVIGTKNSMTNAYNKAAPQWTIESPDGSSPVTQSINAFVSNMNLFIRKKPNDTKEQFLLSSPERYTSMAWNAEIHRQ